MKKKVILILTVILLFFISFSIAYNIGESTEIDEKPITEMK